MEAASADAVAYDDARPQDASSSIHPLLPHLQRLDLKNCTLPRVEDVVQLGQSPVLSSLQLKNFACYEYYGHVPVLWPGPLAALCSLVAKSSLQDLSIAVKQLNAADEWPTALPHGLTRLVISLEDVGQAPEASQQGVLPTAATSSFLDNVQHMQRLQELQLRLCEFDPALLSSIAGLRKLHLDRCQLLPGNQAGTRALLGVMQGLTQLQGKIHLCLQSGCTSGVAPELFAALTASAQLTSLELVPVGGQPLPWGAVRRMFPAGCSMPQLQVLQIKGVEDVTAVDMYAWAMGDRDLVAIANACPGLRELKLNCVVRPGASCAGLQRRARGLEDTITCGRGL
jgi:hypothetical protein